MLVFMAIDSDFWSNIRLKIKYNGSPKSSLLDLLTVSHMRSGCGSLSLLKYFYEHIFMNKKIKYAHLHLQWIDDTI